MSSVRHESSNYLMLLSLFVMSLAIPVGAGVGMKPRFVDDMKNITVEVGQDASFTCVVSEIHGYRVGWVKANSKAIQAIGTHVITHNERVSVSHDDARRKWMLHIAKAQLEDSGPYMCQLNTDPMKSRMGVLNVIIKPDIVDVTGPRAVAEGGNVRLVCDARGEPPPDVFWTRENKDKIIITDKNTGRRTAVKRVDGSVLELHKVKKNEAGSYLCIASNGHPPTVSRRVQLDIKFRPVVHVPVQKVNASPGRKVQIECNIESYPRADVSWEFTAERGEPPLPILSDNKYTKEEFLLSEYTTRTVLSIKNFTKEDVGLYACGARNEMNKDGDKVDGVVYLNMDRVESSTIHYDMYFTEYEISLMPDNDQQVMYYDPESKSHGQWSRKRQYSTLRPGSGRRGHLGEDVRRRGEAGPGGGGGGGQNHQQEDKVDDHSEEDDQKEQHQKQRYNGLLNSSSTLQAGVLQIVLLKLVLLILFVLT